MLDFARDGQDVLVVYSLSRLARSLRQLISTVDDLQRRARSLDDGKLKIARALLADDSLSVGEVAAQLNVAPSTLYRNFPGGRSYAALSAEGG